MTSDGGIESRANRFAISNPFRQSRVKLRDIVTRIVREAFRNPAVFDRNRQLGQFLGITSRPFYPQFLPLHGGSRSGGELEVALFAMDLEQERRPSVHAATDLKGYGGTLSDNPVDDDLVGHGLGDQLAGFLERYAVALAHDERGKLAKFAEAVARI